MAEIKVTTKDGKPPVVGGVVTVRSPDGSSAQGTWMGGPKGNVSVGGTVKTIR